MTRYLSALALLTVSTLAIASPSTEPAEPMLGSCMSIPPLCMTGKPICLCDSRGDCKWFCASR